MATTGGHRSSVSDKRPEVREVREAGPLRSALHTFCEQSTTGLLTWPEIGDHDKLLRLLLPGVYFQDGWNSAVCWNKCTPTNDPDNLRQLDATTTTLVKPSQFTLAVSTAANSGNRQTEFFSGAVGDITKLPDKTYQQWKRNLMTNLNYGFVAESHSPHQYMVAICLFNSQMYIPP